MTVVTNTKEVQDPWSFELTPSRFEYLEGFFKFLSTNQNKKDLQSDKLFVAKIQNLLAYRKVALSILSVRQYGYKFLDCFVLPRNDKEFFFTQDMYFNYRRKIEDEQEVDEEKTELKYEKLQIVKCLRNVNSKYEKRQIFLVEDEENKRYILKRVLKYGNNEKINVRFRREFKVQKLLSDLNDKFPSFNVLKEYLENDHEILTVSEYAGDKDLLEYLLEKQGKNMSEKETKELFREAVKALDCSHNLYLAHRDLSLENFVYNEKKGLLEIIDWGHSCSLDQDSKLTKFEGAIGKPRYFAPELVEMRADVYDARKTDVFALGVCLFSSLTGQMPFGEVTDSRACLLSLGVDVLLKKMNNISLSSEAVSLLQGCLQWNAAKRFTMKEVVTHPFFN